MNRTTLLRASVLVLAAGAILLDTRRVATGPGPFFSDMTVSEINPDASGKSNGGRIQQLAVNGIGTTYYAASEFGGLYQSGDAGVTWSRIDSYTPEAMWDVAVDPFNPLKIYATSRYDGRVVSMAGIAVSEDGGKTWTHPPTATPPQGFCEDGKREQPSAFGIGIDPKDSNHVWVGTNCGVARSLDGGATWTFYDPTPADPPATVFDVVVHNGIVDTVGEDGFARSTDEGANWILPNGFGFAVPAAFGGAIGVSPDEDNVLYVGAGMMFYESLDGGATWSNLGYLPGGTQGRRLFVRLNKRGPSTYDLWTGDRSLDKTSCTTPAMPGPGGSSRCDYNAWVSGLQGATHGDVGDVIFDPTKTVNACPVLYANDGGVHRNTSTSSPACQTPAWVNPDKSPHALWLYSVAVAHPMPDSDPALILGAQDNGAFISPDPGATHPTWWGAQGGGDTFDVLAGPDRIVFTSCCKDGNGAAISVASPGMTNSTEIKNYPMDSFPEGFFYTGDSIAQYGPSKYAVVTTWQNAGLFVTSNIDGNPVAWTSLGGAASFDGLNALRVSRSGGGPHFFVQSGKGGNYGLTPDQIWRYDGDAPGGAWQQVAVPGNDGGFSVYDVNPLDPDTMIASHLPSGGGDPQMMRTTNGGSSWTPLPQLDALMTANGVFRYRNQFGPSMHAYNMGYPQPTLVAYDPTDPNVVVAGATDAGAFFSRDGGVNWERIQNPFWVLDGTPHITRPRAAAFLHTTLSTLSDKLDIFIATMGRGVFRARTRVDSLNLENYCETHPRLCNPIPIPDPLEFLLWPIDRGSIFVDPIANHGACSRDCAPFFNLYLDGFDAEAWDVSVFDGRGAAVPHGLYRTERGVVISLQNADGMFSSYRLAFAPRTKGRAVENRFTSRLEGAERPYVPRSAAEIVY